MDVLPAFLFFKYKYKIMETKIKSIEKGTGEDAVFFSTNPKVGPTFFVDAINEELKHIRFECGLETESIIVYRGYTNGNLRFEIAASKDVSLTFEC